MTTTATEQRIRELAARDCESRDRWETYVDPDNTTPFDSVTAEQRVEIALACFRDEYERIAQVEAA